MPTAGAKDLSIFWYGKRIGLWGSCIGATNKKPLLGKALNLNYRKINVELKTNGL